MKCTAHQAERPTSYSGESASASPSAMSQSAPMPPTPPILERLGDFVHAGREQFPDLRDSNLFGQRWGIVARYRRYLEMVLADYESAFAEWRLRHDASWDSLKDQSGTLDDAQMAEMYVVEQLGNRVQAGIATSHLFVRILLDRVAQAVHGTLIAVARITLSSHSKLQRNLPAFANAHGVQLPDGLTELAVSLEEVEVTYRDKHISHMTQPRSTEGLVWRHVGEIRIGGGVLHRRQDEGLDEYLGTSAIPSEAIRRIDEYLNLMLSFMEANKRLYHQTRADAAHVNPP